MILLRLLWRWLVGPHPELNPPRVIQAVQRVHSKGADPPRSRRP